jgi:hypothetical protein
MTTTLLGAVVLAAPVVAQAAEIPNGGFETGDFTDWTVSGNTGYTSVNSGSTPILGGSENYAYIGPVGSDGVLTQTLATDPGTSYVLSFSLTNFGGPDNDFSVTFDGNPISFAGTPSLPISEPGADAFDWTNYSAIVTASGANTDLSFYYRQDPSYFGLTNISVSAVPLPGAAGLLGSALIGLIGAATLRRKSGPA